MVSAVLVTNRYDDYFDCIKLFLPFAISPSMISFQITFSKVSLL